MTSNKGQAASTSMIHTVILCLIPRSKLKVYKKITFFSIQCTGINLPSRQVQASAKATKDFHSRLWPQVNNDLLNAFHHTFPHMVFLFGGRHPVVEVLHLLV